MNTPQDLFKSFSKNLTFDKQRYPTQLKKLGIIREVKKPVNSITFNQTLQQEKNLKEEIEENESIKEEDSSDSEIEEEEEEATKKNKKNRTPEQIEQAAINRHKNEMRKFRKDNCIYAKGSDIPDPITQFSQLCTVYGLSNELISNLTSQGFTEPTAVQMQCWPLLLSNREVVATAPTGSGKTAAFLLPILHQLKRPRALGFRAVIVSHTRELAEQTYRECVYLAQGTKLKIHLVEKAQKVLEKFGPKSNKKFDILVTTPNRLVYILKEEENALNLNNVEWLIMDECDRLFEGGKSGFRDQLSIIYQACSGPKIKRAFFSATHNIGFQKWCEDNFDNMADISIGQRNTASTDVDQSLVYCGEEAGKIFALKDILRKGFEPPCLIFVQSKERARQLFKELVYEDYTVDAIHSDRTQKQREDCVKAFRAKKLWILICTELMSRGIDFKGVNLVINYDFPPKLESYIHRIGRTGRAGTKGKAVTFWTIQDQVNLGWLARSMNRSGSAVPDWMLNLRKLAKHEKKDARKTKDRGFVSESAKYHQIQSDERKQRKYKKQLMLLRADGKRKSQEAMRITAKLQKVEQKRKSIMDTDGKEADKVEERKKRNREKNKVKIMNKKQKTE